MLIRDILEESEKKYADIIALKWLKKKDIQERNYRDLMEKVMLVRKGLLAEGFGGKHIALIGTSSVEWIESYLGIITGKTVAVPLDAGLPAEDLIDMINRSDSEGLFLSPKNKSMLDEIIAGCPGLKKIWMLQEEELEEVCWMDYEECHRRILDGTLPNCIYEDEFRMVGEYLKETDMK